MSDLEYQIPANGHGLARREVRALGAFFFIFFGGIGFSVGFCPIFLANRGLSLSEIAVLYAVYAATGGLAQVAIGHASDAMGSRKYLAAASCIALGASYLLYPVVHSFWGFFAVYLWSGACYLGGFTLPQAIVSDWTTGAGSTARGFSVTRIWGTVGFIVPLLAVIKWPGLARDTAFLYWIAALYAASAIPILAVREPRIKRTGHGMLKGALKVLASQRSWVFLFCYTLFRLCESGYVSYIGLYLKQMGGGARLVAATYSISAAAEVPLVLAAGRLSDRIGRKRLLTVAFVVWPIRLFLYSMITVPSSVYYIQLLHGLTYGITLVVSVAYMSDVAPRDLRGTAQGLLSVTSAVAMAAGPLLVGLVGDALGLAVTFRVMAAITVVALVLLVAFVKEPRPL